MTAAHLASRLEFTGGSLSWRGSLPWSPMARPGRVTAIRWPASARSRYVRNEFDDGRKLSVLPRRGLMEFISGVHEAEPAIVVDLRLSGRARKWMNAEPPGYIRQRMRAASAGRCSLTQTWAGAPNGVPSISAACTDLGKALTSAFPRVGANSPAPAGAACDYYAVVSDLLHPGQGKRTVEAMVRAGQPGINDDLLIVLTASYG